MLNPEGVNGGQKYDDVTYIMKWNVPASSSVMSIVRADIAENVQFSVSTTGTENLIGRYEIAAVSVVRA
jgi:hypothetical protein